MKVNDDACACAAYKKNILHYPGAAIYFCCLVLVSSMTACSYSAPDDVGLEGTAQPRDVSIKTEASHDQMNTSDVKSGTLTWSGYLSGNKTFTTAGCAESGNDELGSFIAPFQGKYLSTNHIPGPTLEVTIFPTGSFGVVFEVDNKNNTRENSFMKIWRDVPSRGHGFDWKIDNGHYVITLTNFKIPNSNYRDPKHIVLNGTLVCTKLTNG